MLPMECLLGSLKRQPKRKAGNRLIDLALGVARKGIARQWKSANGPTYDSWFSEVEKWAKAEQEAIIREERTGVRTQLLSPTWREVVGAFRDMKEGRMQRGIDQESLNENNNE